MNEGNDPGRHNVCVVGSGFTFASGISHYTCRLANVLSSRHAVGAVLMRRLIPRRLYPGRARVGREGFGQQYDPLVQVFDGVDWYWFPSILRARRFLRDRRPDVVVFEWWTGAVLHSYFLLAFVARRLGARIVVELHETQDTGERRMPAVARYVALLGARFMALADAFVVHSEYDRREMSRVFATGERPIVVVPHGPFDHNVREQESADRTPDAGRTKERKLLFFGTIRPYKGLEHLVEAFDRVDDIRAEQLRLVVVGETWEGWTKPIELIAKSPRRDRIDLVNRYVSDEEVASFFADADAVVLPYTRSSASGPLHIAMAYGLPVVLSDVGGLRDGAAGYAGISWVPPDDVAALTRALDELPSLMGNRYEDPRSWEHTADSFSALFETIR